MMVAPGASSLWLRIQEERRIYVLSAADCGNLKWCVRWLRVQGAEAAAQHDGATSAAHSAVVDHGSLGCAPAHFSN